MNFRAFATVVSASALTLGVLAAPPVHSQEQSKSSLALRTYYLYDLPITQSEGEWWAAGSLEINGKLYGKSVYGSDTGAGFNGGTVGGQYNLKRGCRTLIFTAGISDDQDPDSEARFEVYKGTNRIANFVLGFGESKYKKLRVRRALRLRLTITNLTQDVAVTAGYGNARVRCRKL